jgi:CRISPR-associated protein Cst2
MAHVTGVWLVDAPASALNNQGAVEGGRTDNVVGVKFIRTRAGAFPYVSAQAFRYWLRATLQVTNEEWRAAPIFREQKIAYTDSNPIEYWDDDLFGYMRAGSKKADAKAAREATERANETETETEITRSSPFKVGTLVSIAPVYITNDFGVMSRHDADAGRVLAGQERPADPVPHEHQFYQATLKGLFDLDLQACGTFWRRWKTGYRNLDTHRIKIAEEQGLELVEEGQAYRLPAAQRVQRVAALFEGLAQLEGGAKQSLHYTPVAPSLFLAAVMRGGVCPFQHVIGADERGSPRVRAEALLEALEVWRDQLLSPVYLGWKRGYLDEQRGPVEQALAESGAGYQSGDPRIIFRKLATDLQENPGWLD